MKPGLRPTSSWLFAPFHSFSSSVLWHRCFSIGVFFSAWSVHLPLRCAARFGIGGALALGGAVHIFVGMVEAPLLVRPYLNSMSRGELFALMSCGLAGIAGTMMVIYAALLGPVIPDALAHILIASIISTPAALAVAALMVPFAPDPKETGELSLPDPPASAMEAIVRGTNDGIGIVARIIAMLIVLVALVSLVNLALGLVPHEGDPITLQRIFAYIFWPLLWLIGIPVQELGAASVLMGTKTALNEFVAYLDLSQLPPDALSPRSQTHDDLCAVRFCQFRQPGHSGRRHDHHGARAQA